MSQALALSAAFFYGVGDFTGGFVTRRVSVWTVVAWSHLLGMGLLVIGVLVVPAASVTAQDLVWGALAGAAGVGGLVLLYLSLASGTMAIVAPISGAVSAAVPVVVDVIGGPGLNAREGIGVALALTAILLVGLEHGIGRANRRSLIGAVISGALFGLFFLALAQTDPASGLWPLVAARGASIPIAFGVAALSGVASPPRGSALGLVAIAGNLDMAANIAGTLALQRGPVGVTAVLVSLYPAVTATAAVLVLRERPSGRQLVGIVLALAALIALVG